MSAVAEIPTEHDEETNARILGVSEDLVQGFLRYPFQKIAEESGVPLETVLERIRAMLENGVIRRVRQTMLANKLAEGALVAWRVAEDKLDETFNFMAKEDPFSGHVVIRTTDREISGKFYRLWTTLKVPQGESLEEHGNALCRLTGAEEFLLMPAKGIFALGVGHVRRKSMDIGAKAGEPAKMMTTAIVELDPLEWEVLLALKEELTPEEVCENPWEGRAKQAGVDFEKFCEIAEGLDKKRVIGRFSTFLEHVKPSAAGKRVTRFNALFHWKVPEGMQERAGGEVGPGARSGPRSGARCAHRAAGRPPLRRRRSFRAPRGGRAPPPGAARAPPRTCPRRAPRCRIAGRGERSRRLRARTRPP